MIGPDGVPAVSVWEADVNASCHMNCQTTGYASCKQRLSGGCKTDCEASGALVCEGQYIDVSNLQQCIDYLRNQQIVVMVNFEATATGSSSCEIATGRTRCDALCGVLLLGVAFGLVVLVRRRR